MKEIFTWDQVTSLESLKHEVKKIIKSGYDVDHISHSSCIDDDKVLYSCMVIAHKRSVANF